MSKFFITVLATILLHPSVVLANVTVDFEATPLFSDANVLPGDSVTRSVTVTNTGTETEQVLVGTTNVFTGDLADIITLTIATTNDTYFTDTFNAFFAAGEVSLGALAAGVSKTYDFTADFGNTTDNDLMSSSFGFDLVVGFEGGLQVVNRSSSGGGTDVRVFNETVTETNTANGSAQIGWNTNRSASTYIVCGDVAEGPFKLNPDDSLFGYQFSLPEIESDTDVHSVTLTGLPVGSYECRPASRWSKNSQFTVGSPTVFTLGGRDVLPSPDSAANLPAVATLPISEPEIGATTSATGTPSGQVAGASDTPSPTGQTNVAQVAGSKLNESANSGVLPWWFMLLGLFLVVLFLLLISQSRRNT
jgi:hypothetical protein